MDWYEKWFGKDYLLIYPHRNEEEAQRQIEFLNKHIKLSKGAKVLDLCCGCGRHSIELKKRKYDVIGLDLSAELLDIACSRASENRLDIGFIKCDMREIPYESYFDLIVSFFTSFGYFDDDAENQKVLFAISKALKPGGNFLIDYLNPDYVKKNLVEKDEKKINGGINVIQKRWIDDAKRRINKQVTLIKDDKKSIYNESVRLYSLQEMREMLSTAGLKLTEAYGDFDSSKYSKDSPRMILLGIKNTHREQGENIEGFAHWCRIY